MRPVDVSGQIFSDQTGRFPRVFSRGNRAVMVLYDYDSNAILSNPLKNNTTSELVRAQTQLTQYLNSILSNYTITILLMLPPSTPPPYLCCGFHLFHRIGHCWYHIHTYKATYISPTTTIVTVMLLSCPYPEWSSISTTIINSTPHWYHHWPFSSDIHLSPISIPPLELFLWWPTATRIIG